jgi:hypothetical protein
MYKWIAVAIAIVSLACAGATAAGMKLINKPPTSDGRCRTAPASPTQPTYVIAIGTNASDAGLVDTHLRHLTEVVLPRAAADHARVVIGTISADSERKPTLVADVSLLASGDASDNPENQAAWASQKTSELVACARATTTTGEAANRSDVFGALAWASSVLPPHADGRHVVLLSDDINTTEGCNLTGRDISKTGRQLVADDCGTADYSGLTDADVWLGGVGLSEGEDATTASLTPSTLTEFWTWFVASHNGHVSRAGATLLAAG